jgi:hypothetical protein
MCIQNTCDSSLTDRRSFLIGASATVASFNALQTQGPVRQATQPETRVLDHPGIVPGKVTFKHGGQQTIDGYLARPKADGAYPAVLVIAGGALGG